MGSFHRPKSVKESAATRRILRDLAAPPRRSAAKRAADFRISFADACERGMTADTIALEGARRHPRYPRTGEVIFGEQGVLETDRDAVAAWLGMSKTATKH